MAQGGPERACGGTLRCAAPASVRRREEAATEEEKRVGEAPYLAGKLDDGSIEVEAKRDGGTASSEVGYGGRKPS